MDKSRRKEPRETGFVALAKMAAEGPKWKKDRRDNKRHYFLMVEDYEWDYGPSGTDLYFSGEPLTEPGT